VTIRRALSPGDQCHSRVAGFTEYGLEQRALKIGSEYYDEVPKALPLEQRG
jgi:hypothetical protein